TWTSSSSAKARTPRAGSSPSCSGAWARASYTRRSSTASRPWRPTPTEGRPVSPHRKEPFMGCVLGARTLRSMARSVAASALGTLAMDALLYGRYRSGGGTAAFPAWESSEDLVSWEDAPAPALVAKRALEGVLRREVPPRYARVLNNITHWG